MIARPSQEESAAVRASLGLPPVDITVPGTLIAYGAHESQWGELFLPSGKDTVPVVVVVHGGSWRQRFDASLGAPLAADLREHGIAAWNIEFRRTGGDGGWPATFQDVADAVDALAGAVQAEAGGRLDLSRVAVVGHSSGGHLAGWLVSRHRLPASAPGAGPAVSLRGAVCQAAALDLVTRAEQEPNGGPASLLMGGTPAELGDLYALASPLALLPTGLPVVCVHGADDAIVPLSQSERYVEAARSAGDPAELIALPGVGHFEVIDPGHDAWRVCREALMEILKA
jgi:acetyl esterase/lipase